MVNRRGRWYVAGHDRARDALRVFRLSRIAGPVKIAGPAGSVTVPDGTDVRELVKDWDSAPPRTTPPCSGSGRSRFRAAPQAVPVGPTTAPGWDLVTTRFADLAWYADYARLVRPRRRGPRPAGPARGRHPPAQGGPGVTAAAHGHLGRAAARLLALVPYVVSRKVVGLAETAAAFGMTERELIDDLNLAWCVELRAPEPYCPIDLSYEGGEIVVSQAESIGRPLRLAADEASALLVALRMLAEVPGLEDRSAMSRLIAKLEAAAGEAASVERPGRRAGRHPGRRRRRVRRRRSAPPWPRSAGCTCATTCPAGTRRPSVTSTRCGCSWWRGGPTWRAGAGGPRGCGCSGWTGCSASTCSTCRPRCRPRPSRWTWTQGLFRPSPADVLVELELSAAGRWVAEYYPCESVTDLEDGRLRVALRTPDTGWVRRLAMRLGEDGRVISPPSLVAEVREAAAAALANYVALSPPDPRFYRRKLRLDQGACTLGPRRTSPVLKRTDMVGDLFDSPWKILIIALVIIVLFGSKKLPHAARSLGQSMRILKKEVQGLHEDEKESPAQDGTSAPQVPPAQLAAAPAAAPAEQQSQIDALQQQIRDLQRSATMDTPPANAAAAAEPQRTQSS